MSKTTVVIGASPDPSRYSNMAVLRLTEHGHTVYAVGMRGGKIGETDITTDRPIWSNIDTVTLYVGPQNQAVWQEYILSLKPKRLVFNPGAENPALFKAATAKGIECVDACTLVMLSVGNY